MASQDSKKTFYIVLIVILIFLNGFFAYNHWKASQLNTKLEEEKTQLTAELDSVDAELKETTAMLDSIYALNTEISADLEAVKKELEEKRKQIEALLRDKKELDKARALIKSLKADAQKYMARIDSLNAALAALSDTVKVKEEITRKLQSENQQLLSEKTRLTQKVELSSLLIPENIQATGVFLKSNDREVPTTKAKKTQKLKICFDVPENRGVDPGEKTILLRILNPQGATIAITSEGSGLFVTDQGEETQYTTKAQFTYSNKKQNVCTYWTQTQAFGAGTYKIFFYQNGHQLSSAEFTLK
ncbi:MAG: hypothetical protein KatS3mg031_0256 [Chitinophagales bacterium]|nr:MAG: hypothetical protein KatS3mg031_0256 [Chitinophagales bacterium]